MDIQELITLLIIGLAAGWIASMIMGSKKKDILTHLIVGVIGAFVGSQLFAYLGISITGIVISLNTLIAAIAGSLVLLFAIKFIKK